MSRNKKTTKEEVVAHYLAEIEGLFGCDGWTIDHSKVKKDFIEIEFSNRDTSFADFSLLSDHFGTSAISFVNEYRDDGYCDTCSCPYTVNVVSIGDITKNLPK